MSIPIRYRPYFNYQPERLGYRQHSRTLEAWICKACGRAIGPNNAGAQSHIAKHVRQKLDGPAGEVLAANDARVDTSHDETGECSSQSTGASAFGYPLTWGDEG